MEPDWKGYKAGERFSFQGKQYQTVNEEVEDQCDGCCWHGEFCQVRPGVHKFDFCEMNHVIFKEL